MVKIYKQPFAHDGDAVAIPDASQPNGKMSNANGWTPDYQLPETDPNYKPVGRQEMNGVFKEVTEALGQVQVQGTASWSADGAPYPINAQVYHNGKQWLALRVNSVVPSEGKDWSAIVTDKQLATKAALSHTHTWSQVTGKPETATRWPSLAEVSGKPANYPTTWNNVAAKPAQATRWPTWAEVTGTPTIHTPIGVGQTWQDVTSSRTYNTNYTNTTGRPISVSVNLVSDHPKVSLLVGGVEIDSNWESHNHPGGTDFSMQAIVPAGAIYRVDGIPYKSRFNYWVELR